MASRRPFMQLYVSDYLADTGHLTVEEHGAYLLLIMAYWQRGGLPADEGQLARLARCAPEQWERVRPAVAGLFGRGWKHKRIDAELLAVERKSERRAEAGRAGGNAKAANALGSNASDLPEQNPAVALPSSSDTREQNITQVVENPSVDRPKASPSADPMGGIAAKFDRFWSAYPEKVGKAAARRAFERVAKSRAVTFDALMAGLDRYIAGKPPDRSWCHPTTWLNQGRWEDAPAAPPAEVIPLNPGSAFHAREQRIANTQASFQRIRAALDGARGGVILDSDPVDPAGDR